MEKRDLHFIRTAVKRKWLTPEEGEDCLFLKRKFSDKYTIEEIVRRRQYLEDDAIEALSEVAEEAIRSRTMLFRRRPPPRRKPVPQAPSTVMPKPVARKPKPDSALRSETAVRRADLLGHVGAPERSGLGAAVPRPPSPPPSDLGAAIPSDDTPVAEDATRVVSIHEIQSGLRASQAAHHLEEPGVTEEGPAVIAPSTTSSGAVEVSFDFDAPVVEQDRTIVDPNILAELNRRLKARRQRDGTDVDSAPVPTPGPDVDSTRVGMFTDFVPPTDDRDPSIEIKLESTRPESRPGTSPWSHRPPVEPDEDDSTISVSQREFTDPSPQASPPDWLRAADTFGTASEEVTGDFSDDAPATLALPAIDADTADSLVRPASIDAFDAPVTDDDELEVGGYFGSYFIHRQIARGAMGIVYLAQHGSMTEPVALKVLKGSVAQAPEFLERFHRESRSAAAIQSPHVVQVLDVGMVQNRHYIAMQYVDGWTLKERIESGEQPSLVEALRIGQGIAGALAAAAAQGVVHRDVKPDNVMIARDGTVLLTDFGLAKEMHDTSRSVTGEHDVIVGTPNYMSPEQGVGKPVDHRSDLYSLGATLFHMIVGRPVYDGKTSISIIAKHISREVPDMRALEIEVPVPVGNVLAKLLEKFPDDRYVDAIDTIQAIENAIVEMGPIEREATSVGQMLSSRGILQGTAAISAVAIALTVAVPVLLESMAVVTWEGPVALLRTALLGAAGVTISLWLLVSLGLVRRGELPLPGSTGWVVSVKDLACMVGAASLIAGVVLGPPAWMTVIVAVLGSAVMVSLVYGVLLRRTIARMRPDKGVGRMLAVLGDRRLKRWRKAHAPMLTTLALISTARWALLAYFQATGL